MGFQNAMGYRNWVANLADNEQMGTQFGPRVAEPSIYCSLRTYLGISHRTFIGFGFSSSFQLSSTMSVHFPSSSDYVSRTRFTHARRVPSERTLNRHMACVGEDLSHKVTFCSSVASTYTTVTFTPPQRRVRHSDAADFLPSSARLDRLAEHEEVKAAAGVEKKLKKSYSKNFLTKVRSLIHNRTSGSTSKDPTKSVKYFAPPVDGREPLHPSTNYPTPPPPAAPASIRYQRTIIPGVTTNLSKPTPPQASEPPTRVVRRSRSFNDADRSSLAACLALDEAVRELMARETAERLENEQNLATRSSGESSDIVTDDEETLQNHGSPEGGVWILEDLMDLLKMETDQIAAFVAEDEY
ncbi:hypothetical protein J3R30DRAFT_3422357 [Lentinula aciculospora]|uniref:Uncharacterized protein n=1 Tax=Lentinula aciculospora TaxID=153920 RepID=A0A9W9DXF8_9AGAR|nr:hypothetical protein J3R30DRAFT_3422357 [Lentinula aciculospora]